MALVLITHKSWYAINQRKQTKPNYLFYFSFLKSNFWFFFFQSKEIHLEEEGGFDEVPLTDVAALTTESARNTIQSEETGELSIPSTGSTVIANHVSAAPQTEDAEVEEENKESPNTESLPANGDIDVVIL